MHVRRQLGCGAYLSAYAIEKKKDVESLGNRLGWTPHGIP
jgi:hypothetical protein